MSEYQYYEFRAIDRPLTEKEIDELRRLSTRAEITSTSFANTYNFGDFKGNPDALMNRYFDVFVYVANWGTHRLMFRIPGKFLDIDAVKAYCREEILSFKADKDHVVLEFMSHDEDGDEDWIDGEVWMPSLISLRDEIMRGDFRALYLGWLAWFGSAESADEDEESLEPPVPPGLAKLSGPLKSLAEFLRIDDELIEVAAAGSGGEAPAEPSKDEVEGWVKKLPVSDKDGYLLRLIDGERDILLRAELSRRFREATLPKDSGRATHRTGRRTVARLLEDRDKLAAEKRQKAAEKAAREKAARDRKNKKDRGDYLDKLDPRQAETWREVNKLLATTLPKNYDRAVELLVDLRDLARRKERDSEVEERIRELRQKYRSKPSLIKRLDQQGLGQ